MRCCEELKRIDYKKTVDAYGKWLEPYPWSWYGHLTFAKDRIYTEAASRMFEQAIQDLGNGNIIYVRAIEWHRDRFCTHIHCLIGNSKEKIVWKHGIYKMESYDPQKGARFYLAKFSMSDKADLDYKLYQQ